MRINPDSTANLLSMLSVARRQEETALQQISSLGGGLAHSGGIQIGGSARSTLSQTLENSKAVAGVADGM